MDLFVRESGPFDAPAIVFLHGGYMSGWSWDPVVHRMQRYRCLVPDLPQYGKSSQHGTFEIRGAAEAAADLIRTRVGAARAHVVGFSLGAQVGLQLLASEPELVDRAVLCGTPINTLARAQTTHVLLRWLTRSAWFQRAAKRHWDARGRSIPSAKLDDYREDARLMTRARLAHIVMASAGFTAPARLAQSHTPTLFVTGADEMPFTRRCAAALAQQMPNGIDMVAIGMRHDWPLLHPDLFARTVDAWLSQTALPPEMGDPEN